MSMKGSPEEFDDGANFNHQISMLKHVKKKAANDAQLLMNRIALIQKEEERARKKIQETKERAAEILALRHENEKRAQAYTSATGEVNQLQKVLIAKNREQDAEGRKARLERLQSLKCKKKEDVSEMLMEKKYLTQLMVQEQSRDIQLKQKKREDIRKMEEEARLRREAERREKERRMKEMYEKKVAEEAEEAKRAERLVKALEKKEREWIERLRSTQTVQDTAFEQLEQALNTAPPSTLSQSKSTTSRRGRTSSPHTRSSNMSESKVGFDIEHGY